MNEKSSYVYILTNYKQNVFYIGITSNLLGRIYQHKNKMVDGFTKKYNVNILIYYEIFSDINEAITREKKIKKWKKEWKWNVINKVNPMHIDLYSNGNILPLKH